MTYEQLKPRLAASRFRSRFHLTDKDRAYIAARGWDVIEQHARDLISARLAPAVIPNDGRQTPMRGHPVFIAQHATATCCRDCLFKWHGIPKGHDFSPRELDYVVSILLAWLHEQA